MDRQNCDSTAFDAARLYPHMSETAKMLFSLVRYEKLIPGADTWIKQLQEDLREDHGRM